jgi:phosphatidylinositol 3,5-bisphosphate 5-phosphatase
MGYSALASQALSAPPYLIAFVVVLLTSYLSDRLRTRSVFVMFSAILAALGYSMLCLSGIFHLSAPYRYLGIYPATSGFFSAITIIITWTVNNQQSSEGKGTGMAILNIIGQLGPLVGVRLFPDTDAPYYVKGMSVCAGFMLGVGILAAGLRWWLGRENARIELKEKEEGWEMGEDAEGLMGRRRRTGSAFRYIL